jgi:hypothetical protein
MAFTTVGYGISEVRVMRRASVDSSAGWPVRPDPVTVDFTRLLRRTP